MACVREMPVQNFERQARIEYVPDNPEGPDLIACADRWRSSPINKTDRMGKPPNQWTGVHAVCPRSRTCPDRLHEMQDESPTKLCGRTAITTPRLRNMLPFRLLAMEHRAFP